MAKGKILVVDDEIYIVHILGLQSPAWRAIRSSRPLDGEQPLEKARAPRSRPHRLDIMMPKLDGYETCQAVQGDDATRAIPVILLSAKGATSTRRWASRSAPND